MEMNRNSICAFFSALILVVFFTSTVFSAEGKFEDEYREAIEAEADVAIKTLSKLARQKKNLRVKYLSKAELSKIYLEQEEYQKARKCVADCGDFSYLNKAKETDCGTAYLKCYLALALLEAKDKNVHEALRMLSYAENKTSGFDKALTLTKYGEVLTVLDKPEEAVGYLKKAEEFCSKHLAEARKLSAGQAKEESSDLAAWNALFDQIFEAKYELRIALTAKEFGHEYARYVKLRILYDRGLKQKSARRKKKYFVRASKVCDEIIKIEPDSIYGQAAKFYHAKCAIEMGDYKNAVKELKKFVKEKPDGLYRGEAMMLLGKIELEQNWDAKASEKYYVQALNWFRQIRAVRDATELYAQLPQKVQEAAKPKIKPVTYDIWHRMVYNSPSDMALVNRQTAPWYVSSQEKECLFMTGFFLFMNGKYPEAKKSWEQIGNLDADIAILQAKNIPNALARLISACEQNRMVLPPEERKYLKGKKNKLCCAYAELNYLLERFETAKKFYEQILNNPKSSDTEKAIAYIGLGNYVDMTCQTKGTKERQRKAEYFEKAIKLGGKTEVAGDAIIRLGCYFQASTETNKLSKRYFKQYLKKFPNKRYTGKAMFRLALFNLENGNMSKVKILLNKLNKLEYSDYEKHLTKLMQNTKIKKEIQ
jgi:tetratricopeptide (TPR) repeat protein